jgi:SAM-dependent methyltransferase
MDLTSALDVGCGIGDFSKILSNLDFSVVGTDGREKNVAEARRRYPAIPFFTANAEELPVSEMGTFDLVLCFGLLYHLENPFRAIRSLRALTEKVLLIESMCLPGAEPKMELLDEGVAENQGLSYVAFYPSESCLTKMLYRSGFPFVYRSNRLPADELYTTTMWKKRRRTMLAASTKALTAPNLELVTEPFQLASADCELWSTRWSRLYYWPSRLIRRGANRIARIPRFLGRPFEEKREILFWYLRRFWHHE